MHHLPNNRKGNINIGIKGRPDYTFLASVPEQNVSLHPPRNQSSLQPNLTLRIHQLHTTTTPSQISKAYKNSCSMNPQTPTLAECTWLKTVMCINHQWEPENNLLLANKTALHHMHPLERPKPGTTCTPKSLSFATRPPVAGVLNGIVEQATTTLKKKIPLNRKKHMKWLYYQKLVSKSQQQSRSQANRGKRKLRHLAEDYKHTFSNFSYRTKQRNALVDTVKSYTSKPKANQYIGSATAEQTALRAKAN